MTDEESVFYESLPEAQSVLERPLERLAEAKDITDVKLAQEELQRGK